MSEKIDLSKVKDPFEADPQTTQEPAQTEEKTEAQTEPQVDLASENEKLKTQLEAAQRVQVVVQQPVHQEPIPQMTQEQLQAQAEALGFTDPKQVESIGKIAAHIAMPAFQKANLLEQELLVERAVNSAKKSAQNADPQFSKLEAYVDEFLDSVPVSEKMDKEKLKSHMERATFFAKGKMGIQTQQRRPAANTSTIKDDSTQEQEGNHMKGPETYETPDRKVRLTIQPRVTDAVRKMHSHPSIEGGVQIDPRDEWKGPVFQKDVRSNNGV